MYVTTPLGLEQDPGQIDLERAVRLNRRYARRLGWQQQYNRIAEHLGFKDFTPDERTFAEAVASWQYRHGGLAVDGIIGPKTWRRLHDALIKSQPPPTPRPPLPPAGTPALGTFARVRSEIDAALITEEEARRWGVRGSLLSQDNYRLRIQHPGPGALNRFRRYHFRGANKCNLFALDIAWRSGFRVPILNIAARKAPPRYSYPLANMLTTHAERAFQAGETVLKGRDGTPWGWMASRSPAEDLNGMISQGQLFIIAGWRRSGTGHVGIIGQINAKIRESGPIRKIVYSGWEPLGSKATALPNRTWRTVPCSDTRHCQKNTRGYCAIHLIGLYPEPAAARRAALTRILRKCRLI